MISQAQNEPSSFSDFNASLLVLIVELCIMPVGTEKHQTHDGVYKFSIYASTYFH
jgi:hypothetical protein